jgi:hypothetical protein
MMTIVKEILPQMPGVGQPQRKFIETIFVTILALRGRVTYRNLSRYSDYSERTIARHFERKFDWAEFHQQVMKQTLDSESELMAVQDASFIPKSGKKTHGVGHFFNGCAGRSERGLEISALAVVDVKRRCALTLGVAQTPPGAAGNKEEAEETRMDFYRCQLREHRHRLPASVKYLAVDGYYAKLKYIDEAVSLDLHPITKLRCDADCNFLYTGAHAKRRGRKRKYDGKVNWQDLSRFDYLGTLEDDQHLHLYTTVVWHNSLKRCLRVVVLVNRKNPAKPRYIVLASTDLELDGKKLVDLYGLRFQIEFLFRDSKQFTGLSDCQARGQAALDFHFNASLATLNLVLAEDLRAQSDSPHRVFSMASWKQCKFNERLLDLFIDNLALDPTWVKIQPCYHQLRTYGAIAA